MGDYEIYYRNKKENTSEDTKFEDFKLGKVIGRTSYGKIVKARNNKTDELFAVKIVLNRSSRTTVFILDFLPGGELFFHIKDRLPRRFTLEESTFYIAEITSALKYFHERDYIYVDLQRGNLVLNKLGHITLTGVDSVCFLKNRYPSGASPQYLSFDLIIGSVRDEKCDYWTLGILLYEMITGLPPFYSENTNEIYELIYEGPLEFPKFMESKEYKNSRDLITKLLERKHKDRIIMDDIQKHPFFESIDWNKLVKLKLHPPLLGRNQLIEKEKKLMVLDERERIDFLMSNYVFMISNSSDVETKVLKISGCFEAIVFFSFL